MYGRSDMVGWVYEALADLGGRARIVEIAEKVWKNHEKQIKSSGKFLYTWQYDMRWAGQQLRDAGKFRPAKDVQKGFWETS